jgi:hypothetical protein
MHLRFVGLVWIAVLVVGGCAGRSLAPGSEAGRYSDVARAVEADPSLQMQERPLFEAGLAHALPQSEVYRPALAKQRFDRLLELYPRTRYATVVSYLAPLLAEVARLEAEAGRQADEAAELRAEVARLNALVEELTQARTTAEARAERSRETAERLDAELRQRAARIRTLEEKLQELMRIDLKPPP